MVTGKVIRVEEVTLFKQDPRTGRAEGREPAHRRKPRALLVEKKFPGERGTIITCKNIPGHIREGRAIKDYIRRVKMRT